MPEEKKKTQKLILIAISCLAFMSLLYIAPNPTTSFIYWLGLGILFCLNLGIILPFYKPTWSEKNKTIYIIAYVVLFLGLIFIYNR